MIIIRSRPAPIGLRPQIIYLPLPTITIHELYWTGGCLRLGIQEQFRPSGDITSYKQWNLLDVAVLRLPVAIRPLSIYIPN
jgi:hypothetical protein